MHYSLPLSLKTASEGFISGHAALFNVRDRHGDSFLPGSFASSLARHQQFGTAPALLDNHNAMEPLGAWHLLAEDGKGLAVEGQLALTLQRAKSLFEVGRLGKSLFLSVGFLPVNPPEGRRTVFSEVDLVEISLVTAPSQPGTAVTMKMLRDNESTRELEHHLRDLGLSRREAARATSALWPILRGESAQSDELTALQAALTNRTNLYR